MELSQQPLHFKLNKIQQIDDKFDSENYKFEIVDMDGKRVIKFWLKRMIKKIWDNI